MSTSVTKVTGPTPSRVTLCSMPGGTLRERQRVETRDVILDTALDLIEAKGFEHTTVEDIAAAAGISSRTFFRYFESKNALLFDEDKDHEHDDMTAALATRPKHESTTEALRNVLREQLVTVFAHDNGRKLRQMRVILREPALRALAKDSFHEHGPDLAKGFAARLGKPADDLQPRVLAAAFTEAIWVIMERWSAAGAEFDQLPPMIDEAFDAIAAFG